MDVADRIRLCMLTLRIDENKEFCDRIGIKDTSRLIDKTYRREENDYEQK